MVRAEHYVETGEHLLRAIHGGRVSMVHANAVRNVRHQQGTDIFVAEAGAHESHDIPVAESDIARQFAFAFEKDADHEFVEREIEFVAGALSVAVLKGRASQAMDHALRVYEDGMRMTSQQELPVTVLRKRISDVDCANDRAINAERTYRIARDELIAEIEGGE